MNIKKYTLKTICAALVCTTFLSGLTAVNATEAIITESPMDEPVENETSWTIDEEKFEEIEVTYKQSSSYFVTIPKTIALDMTKQAKYSVKVTGDIDTNQRVYVAPIDGISSTENIDFYMTDQTPDSKKADVVATVTQRKMYWDSVEIANGYEETNNSISAPNLTAGTWKGTFQVAINLETMAEHTHDYVDGVCTGCGEKDPNAEHTHKYLDGKCECGEIDPNHEHNYEDGTCSICGKETDPYEVAPANEYTNWRYRLDSDNQAIILERYNNTSATDVIVYGNYVINGTLYKTQISSNLGKWSYNPSVTYASADYMFAEKSNIKTIIFSDDVDTSDCADMGSMFYNCTNLISIDFGSNFVTSNTTSIGSMFLNCKSLVSLDLSGFNTENVTSMRMLFDNCYELNDINFGDNFNTSNVTNMSDMFNNCSSLVNLDLSNWDTSNVTDMESMFSGCKTLTSLDISSFDTSNVTTLRYMFYNCNVLVNLDVSSFNTSKVKNMGYLFGECYALESLDLSNFETSNVTNMESMFIRCSLTELDLSSFDTSNVTTMTYMFFNCSNLKTIYATSGKWITSKATVTKMFTGCGTSKVTYK